MNAAHSLHYSGHLGVDLEPPPARRYRRDETVRRDETAACADSDCKAAQAFQAYQPSQSTPAAQAPDARAGVAAQAPDARAGVAAVAPADGNLAVAMQTATLASASMTIPGPSLRTSADIASASLMLGKGRSSRSATIPANERAANWPHWAMR
jgi:hypothetical protein